MHRPNRFLPGTVAFAIAATLAVVCSVDQTRPSRPAAATRARIEPIQTSMHGWTVHVDPALLKGQHADAGGRALSMLGNHLQRISLLLEGEVLRDMQKLEIWIEREHATLKNMQYHPSKRWLQSHDHDERLAKKVHIPVAKNLLSRAQLLKHPAVVLHELAHAYHDQVLDFNEPRILEAFGAARAAKKYLRVLAHTGKQVRHYALTDHKEYFAEGTEAYLYRNDFYPFVRAELQQYDPQLHTLLTGIWGR